MKKRVHAAAAKVLGEEFFLDHEKTEIRFRTSSKYLYRAFAASYVPMAGQVRISQEIKFFCDFGINSNMSYQDLLKLNYFYSPKAQEVRDVTARFIETLKSAVGSAIDDSDFLTAEGRLRKSSNNSMSHWYALFYSAAHSPVSLEQRFESLKEAVDRITSYQAFCSQMALFESLKQIFLLDSSYLANVCERIVEAASRRCFSNKHYPVYEDIVFRTKHGEGLPDELWKILEGQDFE